MTATGRSSGATDTPTPAPCEVRDYPIWLVTDSIESGDVVLRSLRLEGYRKLTLYVGKSGVAEATRAARTATLMIVVAKNAESAMNILTRLRWRVDAVLVYVLSLVSTEQYAAFNREDKIELFQAPMPPAIVAVAVERHFAEMRLQTEMKLSLEGNEAKFTEMMTMISRAIEAKDMSTSHHSENVSRLARHIAHEIGLSAETVRTIALAARLHDIGKMAVPDAILTKPSELTHEERVIIRRHPLIAAMILDSVEQISPATEAIRHHHEYYDGTGYPSGLEGDAIPLGARIIAVAGAYDIMTNVTPYSAARPDGEAVGELERCAGRQFDPLVVEAFVRWRDSQNGAH
ncbi:MAG TPA: HD domain-containing phosphohydrolase [Planctomycetota bacterium]|jgi:putative nucleotidyltransferase with HDIG domain|nr:HD domain-containing phosphohydrolase [Planctomycetota bacterium]